eukprot:6449133-Pyramimonas_sp.AAC.1
MAFLGQIVLLAPKRLQIDVEIHSGEKEQRSHKGSKRLSDPMNVRGVARTACTCGAHSGLEIARGRGWGHTQWRPLFGKETVGQSPSQKVVALRRKCRMVCMGQAARAGYWPPRGIISTLKGVQERRSSEATEAPRYFPIPRKIAAWSASRI